MVRLLVADAQCIVRMGLKELCRDMGGFGVAGEAASGEETLEALIAASYDMVVLDPCLPGRRHASSGDMGGINLINTIRVRHANLPILVFTANDDSETINKILSIGVSGFLDKNSDRETLVTAMRKVAIGQNFISPEVAIKLMFEKFIDRGDVLQTNLTSRESQVLRLLGQGKSLNAIAKELFISSRTVSTHKMRVMQKMGFKSNAELFHYAREFGKADGKREETQDHSSVGGESGPGDSAPSGVNEDIPVAEESASAAGQIETVLLPHRPCSDAEPDLPGGA